MYLCSSSHFLQLQIFLDKPTCALHGETCPVCMGENPGECSVWQQANGANPTATQDLRKVSLSILLKEISRCLLVRLAHTQHADMSLYIVLSGCQLKEWHAHDAFGRHLAWFIWKSIYRSMILSFPVREWFSDIRDSHTKVFIALDVFSKFGQRQKLIRTLIVLSTNAFISPCKS